MTQAHNHPSRRQFLAGLAGAMAGLLLWLRAQPSAAALQVEPLDPVIPDPEPTPELPFAPDHIVYVSDRDAPDADGSRARPIALSRALIGEGGVVPNTWLALVDTEYQLSGVITPTIGAVEIAHVDGAPVTVRLDGVWAFTGARLLWKNVTIVGSAF